MSEIKNKEEKINLNEVSNDSYNKIWRELKEMRNDLKCFDIQTVKDYVKIHLSDDIKNIRDEFHKQFDEISNDDELKIEVMILLGELGIKIYKKKIN